MRDNPPPFYPDLEPVNLLPFGTGLLLGATILFLATACGMGAYLYNLGWFWRLESAGYVFWPSQWLGGWGPNMDFLDGQSWVRFVPGQSFSLAFVTPPLVRAICTALALGAGGLILLFALRRWTGLGALQKHPALVIGIALLVIGPAIALLPPSRPITLDLSRQILVTGQGTLPLSDVTGFDTYIPWSRHTRDTQLLVTKPNGHQQIIAYFSSCSNAFHAQHVLQRFLTSGGGAW